MELSLGYGGIVRLSRNLRFVYFVNRPHNGACHIQPRPAHPNTARNHENESQQLPSSSEINKNKCYSMGWKQLKFNNNKSCYLDYFNSTGGHWYRKQLQSKVHFPTSRLDLEYWFRGFFLAPIVSHRSVFYCNTGTRLQPLSPVTSVQICMSSLDHCFRASKQTCTRGLFKKK